MTAAVILLVLSLGVAVVLLAIVWSVARISATPMPQQIDATRKPDAEESQQ